MRFADRADAGSRLAREIGALLPETPDRLQVLALPRGGVPVGRPIADRLGVDLRVLLVRKLGVPGHEELAMGAIAAVGDRIRTVRNHDILRRIDLPDRVWQRIWDSEAGELRRRMERFGDWTAEPPEGPVVLVDDGMATGATVQAAVAAVRGDGILGPGDESPMIIVAVPVAAPAAIDAVSAEGVRVVCLSRPDPLLAIGESYRDFHQLEDVEVIAALSGQE